MPDSVAPSFDTFHLELADLFTAAADSQNAVDIKAVIGKVRDFYKRMKDFEKAELIKKDELITIQTDHITDLETKFSALSESVENYDAIAKKASQRANELFLENKKLELANAGLKEENEKLNFRLTKSKSNMDKSKKELQQIRTEFEKIRLIKTVSVGTTTVDAAEQPAEDHHRIAEEHKQLAELHRKLGEEHNQLIEQRDAMAERSNAMAEQLKMLIDQNNALGIRDNLMAGQHAKALQDINMLVSQNKEATKNLLEVTTQLEQLKASTDDEINKLRAAVAPAKGAKVGVILNSDMAMTKKIAMMVLAGQMNFIQKTIVENATNVEQIVNIYKSAEIGWDVFRL